MPNSVMPLRLKKVKGKNYYYLHLAYFLVSAPKAFSKYVGLSKPSKSKLAKLETAFKDELIGSLYTGKVSCESVSKDDLIKAALFRDLFHKKYESLSPVKKRKFDVGQTVLFTLTTLTTEDVDVELKDVLNALGKTSQLSLREQISKNMLNAIELIQKTHGLDTSCLLRLHKTAMADFETKKPGTFRDKQVYIRRQDPSFPLGREIAFQPPSFAKIHRLIGEFMGWYRSTGLNPLEKAALAHFKLYRIHPFLDGNKRICRLVFNQTLLNSGFPLLNISEQKEKYFEALIRSTETNNPKPLADFTLKEYFRQVKRFLKNTKGWK